MQGVKIEFVNKYTTLIKVAEKGLDNFPDELSEFMVNEFELQAVVFFKVNNDNSLTVLGKSASAKKNYLKGTIFSCSSCKLLSNDTYSTFNSDPECEILISDFIIYEACNLVRITDSDRIFIKYARKTPFLRTDIDSFKIVSDLLSGLFKSWIIARGGELSHSAKSTAEIVNVISAELMNPANTILGNASLLYQSNLTSSQLEFVRTIKNNAQHLLFLLSDLTDIAKIDSGITKENKTTIKISNFLDEIKKIYDKTEFDITYETDKNIPSEVSVDQQKLKYIFDTLLACSFKYAPKGNITIKVSSMDNKQLLFRISDNGDGLPTEKRKALFEPLTLISGELIKSKGLEGLNLTLTKKYISLLGGEIKVDSIIGSGTTFTFTINSEYYSEIERQISQLPPPSVKNRVLVIEDDYATSKLLSNYLSRWGYDPTIVNTEEQTFSLIEREHFLAIIMDIALPNINGLELLKKVHEHKNTKHTPVIVCSVEAEQQKAFMLGAVEYFVKPIKYKFLVEILQSYKLKKDSNILCVDDDLPTLDLLKEAITTVGFNPIIESVSANVMDLIDDKEIDLAIIDLDMPTPNGFELIKLIKSNPKFANLPIVIYTGKENFQEDLKQIDGLFEELLSKRSTNIEDLADVIDKMINRYETPTPIKEVLEKKDVIKILLAEDYKHSQIIVTRLLKKNSFENIVVVENGEEAYEMAKKDNFDLILMDMQMPVMNGFEATEKIRQLGNYNNVPIIALTAFAMKGDREKCLEAGATDYIPKPIDSKEFIEKVKYYTNQNK